VVSITCSTHLMMHTSLVMLVAPLTAAQRVASDYQKDTYSMSHPFAWKAFMEEYFPTAENLVQENSTDNCVEWVKLCIDDGHMTSCQGPAGNFQLHSVGAYARDSGAKSMEQIELDFTQSMGDMTTYDPYFEYNMAFLTDDLDHYVRAFDNGQVPYFASSWIDELTQNTYASILVQTPGSLAPGAKSLLNIQLLSSTSASPVVGTSVVTAPGASSSALKAAHQRLASAPRKLSANNKPVLTRVHRSFASSDVARDAEYFESALQGSKDYQHVTTEHTVYGGKMQQIDTVEIRYVESVAVTQGPVSVAEWETYQVNLHKTCFDSENNDGFDRLADNHGGHPIATFELDPYIKAQRAAGLPYRFYGGFGRASFFYMYGPNGWGCQIIGACTDASLCPGSAGGYDMCTQGISGHCNKDIAFALV